MRHTDEHKLEGLLQARSEDMGRRRRPRQPAQTAASMPEPSAPHDAGPPPAVTRACADCDQSIEPRRVRAMPSASRCLDCQRAFELAREPA